MAKKQPITLISDDIKDIHALTESLVEACRTLNREAVSNITSQIYIRCISIDTKIDGVCNMLGKL